MKPHRSILAALMLVAWLFAGAHTALEHGGNLSGTCVTCTHCHEGDSAPADGEHHHCDLGAVTADKAITARKMPLAALLWTPLAALIFGQFPPVLHAAPVPVGWATIGASPPDARASGWLLVAHTARPVRGPALAA